MLSGLALVAAPAIAQQKDIAELQEWLREHGKRPQ